MSRFNALSITTPETCRDFQVKGLRVTINEGFGVILRNLNIEQYGAGLSVKALMPQAAKRV